MDIGIEFGGAVVLVIIVFLSSRKIPNIIRQLVRIVASIRLKTNKVAVIQRAEKPAERLVDENVGKKAELRKKYLTIRRAKSKKEIKEKSELLFHKLTQSKVWLSSTVVSIYLSMPDEVQTDPLIISALSHNKRVVVPFLPDNNKVMVMSELTDIGDVETGSFNVREPKKDSIRYFPKSDIDLVICPGVAFDRNGGRLGFGKGYYDRFLKGLQNNVPVAGLAFNNQILAESLPLSYNDVPMDIIFTETETIQVQ